VGRPIVDRASLDHPEHFDDEIRAYKTSGRYVPTQLEQLLFELAGHRCTICSAPWLEVHHIDALAEGGETKFDNLIVICPNCHTRIHSDGVPSKAELRHYKLKQEIAYELPIVSRLTDAERRIVSETTELDPVDQVAWSRQHIREVEAHSQETAIAECRRQLGLVHLQECGMIIVEQVNCVTRSNGTDVLVALNVRLTGKGTRWVRYLRNTGRLPQGEP
jgi:hypothetical protein